METPLATLTTSQELHLLPQEGHVNTLSGPVILHPAWQKSEMFGLYVRYAVLNMAKCDAGSR